MDDITGTMRITRKYMGHIAGIDSTGLINESLSRVVEREERTNGQWSVVGRLNILTISGFR